MRLNNIKIPGNNLKVTGNLRIESEDLSGQTSTTESSHKGFKPKKLSCSLIITFKNASSLTKLLELIEAVEENGKQRVYTIVQPLAEAMKIRQVRFMDNFAAREDESLKAWQVSFTLVEYLSVAEKIEKRQAPAPIVEQKAEGQTVAAAAQETTEAEVIEPELTNIEQILKYFDEALA